MQKVQNFIIRDLTGPQDDSQLSSFPDLKSYLSEDQVLEWSDGFRMKITDVTIAWRVSQLHQKYFESWPYGKIKEYWREKGHKYRICIRYEDKTWFHYDWSDGHLIWW